MGPVCAELLGWRDGVRLRRSPLLSAPLLPGHLLPVSLAYRLQACRVAVLLLMLPYVARRKHPGTRATKRNVREGWLSWLGWVWLVGVGG